MSTTTFRCSYVDSKGEVSFDCELGKLVKSFDFLAQGVPVIVPFYYVRARFVKIKPEQYRLYDYAIAETKTLIEAVTGTNGIGSSELQKQITHEFMKTPKPLKGSKDGCGVNFNSTDKKGFIFAETFFLANIGVPFLYVWPNGDQSRLQGELFQ